MLIEFSVKNFLSYRDKVTLSMEKGNGDENLENVFNNNKEELLKIAAIYGANASGKSNLLKAFTFAIMMVRSSNIIPVNGTWNFVKPFLFDDKTNDKPSEFEFLIMINNIKYKYCFSTDINKIYSESLEAYYTQKPTTIFKRTNINHYEFYTDKNKLESIVSKNTDNKLFLSTATNWNYEKTKDIFLWFNNAIDTYDVNSFNIISDQDLIDYSKEDSELKNFALKLLKEADILIKDIHVNYEEKDAKVEMIEFVKPIVRNQENIKVKNINIEMDHEIIIDKNNSNIYRLNFNDESSGTKVLFTFAPFLKKAFESSKIIIVDELEKSMHPALVEYIVKLFNNKNINKANSQLIFTTHATNILDLEILRRDQIWFTEKNPNTGISELYPLDSFSVRKDENIQKGYLNGRYGAIPFIKDIDLWLENK